MLRNFLVTVKKKLKKINKNLDFIKNNKIHLIK